MEHTHKGTALRILMIAIIVGLIAYFGFKYKAPERIENETLSREQVQTSAYENGNYTALGAYTSPAGAESIEIMLSIESGTVRDANFVGKAEHPISQKLQGQFSEGFKEFVIGKPLDEISLTVVNGASLVPKGFMDALEKIKAEARA